MKYFTGTLLLVLLVALVATEKDAAVVVDMVDPVGVPDVVVDNSTSDSDESVEFPQSEETKIDETNRTTRSIGNIARLLLGGSVPPDHPLVKYPDSVQTSASSTHNVIAAVPGMNVVQATPAQGILPQPQQLLLQQQVGAATFSIPSFMLPNSINNNYHSSIPLAGFPQNAQTGPVNDMSSYQVQPWQQPGTNSYAQSQYTTQYQAPSPVPQYQTPTSGFNSGGHSQNPQAYPFNPQANSVQTGGNTHFAPGGPPQNGNSNLPAPGFSNGGNSHQANGASHAPGSGGNQYNSQAYSAPQAQQQPYEGSGPPYQASPNSYTTSAPWQNAGGFGGQQNNGYYSPSSSHLNPQTSYNAPNNNYQAPSGNNYQPPSGNFNNQPYNQPPSNLYNYNSQPNYQQQQQPNHSPPPYNYNNAPPNANAYNNQPPQSNSYNAPPSNSNNYPVPPSANTYSAPHNHNSQPPSSYPPPASNSYNNYQPPSQPNSYNPNYQQQQPAPQTNNNYPQNNQPYNNNAPPAHSGSYNPTSPSNKSPPRDYTSGYNAPRKVNEYTGKDYSRGKENQYAPPSSSNALSKPYPTKHQSGPSKYPAKYVPSDGKGRSKGEFDHLKYSGSGGRKTYRKPVPTSYSNSYNSNVDMTYKSSKLDGSYNAPMYKSSSSTTTNSRTGKSRNYQRPQTSPASYKLPAKSTSISYHRYPQKSLAKPKSPAAKIYASTPSSRSRSLSRSFTTSAEASAALHALQRLSPMAKSTSTSSKVILPIGTGSRTRQFTATNAYLPNFRELKVGRRSHLQLLPDPRINTQGLPKKDPIIVPSIAVFHMSYI